MVAASMAAAYLAMVALIGPGPVVLGSPSSPGVDRGDSSGADCGWVAPVTAPVIDGFRPPDNPYGPGGNRGIEYGTEEGQVVAAVANGVVTFVGPVGGRRWLVVSHPGGLRSTYGPLHVTSVVTGQAVGRGEVVGEADRGLHLTARAGDRYVDPAPLLDGACGRARLVRAGEGRPPPPGDR